MNQSSFLTASNFSQPELPLVHPLNTSLFKIPENLPEEQQQILLSQQQQLLQQQQQQLLLQQQAKQLQQQQADQMAGLTQSNLTQSNPAAAYPYDNPNSNYSNQIPSGNYGSQIPAGNHDNQIPSGNYDNQFPSSNQYSNQMLPDGNQLPPSGDSVNQVPPGGQYLAANDSQSPYGYLEPSDNDSAVQSPFDSVNYNQVPNPTVQPDSSSSSSQANTSSVIPSFLTAANVTTNTTLTTLPATKQPTNAIILPGSSNTTTSGNFTTPATTAALDDDNPTGLPKTDSHQADMSEAISGQKAQVVTGKCVVITSLCGGWHTVNLLHLHVFFTPFLE
jgi:hypothetical protein